MGHSQNATNICYSDLHLHGEGENEKEANVRFSLGFKVIYYEYVNILKPEAFASQAFQAGGLHPTTCEPFSRVLLGLCPQLWESSFCYAKSKLLLFVCACVQEHVHVCGCLWGLRTASLGCCPRSTAHSNFETKTDPKLTNQTRSISTSPMKLFRS